MWCVPVGKLRSVLQCGVNRDSSHELGTRSVLGAVLSRLDFCFHFIVTLLCFLDFISLSLERGEGREKGRETLMHERNFDQLPLARPQLGTWPTTQACALTGNLTSDLPVCRLALNPLSHSSQGITPFF